MIEWAINKISKCCCKKSNCLDYSPIVQRPFMDWVSRRLCYAVDNTDRSVFWTSIYSLIRRTWSGGDGVCTHVNSRRKALLFRDSNRQPDLNLDYKPSTLTNCAIGSPHRICTILVFYYIPFGLGCVLLRSS